MTRHEAPSFKMKVERGRLVPATAYDAERLDSYRQNTIVNVRFTRDDQRIGEKKWHAAINRAVKTCPTPWKTAAEASEAIKLALGIVNLSKTIGGAWMSYPKSLTELDDPELDEAVEQMFSVLYGVTGVDPAAWREQTAHVSQDARDADGGSDTPTAPQIAASEAAIEQEPASADISPAEDAAGSGASASPPTAAADLSLHGQLIGSLKAECIAKLLHLAGDADLTPQQQAENIDLAAGWWRDALPDDHAFVRAVIGTAMKVSKGELKASTAKLYLEGLL